MPGPSSTDDYAMADLVVARYYGGSTTLFVVGAPYSCGGAPLYAVDGEKQYGVLRTAYRTS